MKRTTLLVLGSLFLMGMTSSCASDDDRPRVAVDPVPPSAWVLEPDLARFADWTSGSFVGTEDPGMRLDCLRIWTERKNLWLFVELRRRYGSDAPEVEVWRIERREDASLRAQVYDLPEPQSEFYGAWKTGTPLAAIGPKDLVPRDTEALVLIARSTSFQGGTSTTTGERARRVVITAQRVVWQIGGTSAEPTTAMSFARVP